MKKYVMAVMVASFGLFSPGAVVAGGPPQVIVWCDTPAWGLVGVGGAANQMRFLRMNCEESLEGEIVGLEVVR